MRRLVLLAPFLLAPDCEPDKSGGDSDDDFELVVDLDGDGYADDVDCDDNDPTVYPGASEVCDFKDNDCDGAVDTDDSDLQGSTLFQDIDLDGFGDEANPLDNVCPADGLVEQGGDCDDANDAVNPDASEVCDEVDNDCDGATDDEDDDVDGGDLYYEDLDEDAYGNEDRPLRACVQPPGYASVLGDCDDDDASVHPGATEDCTNGKDNDCNGLASCEDASCAGSSACDEDCEDQADNDLDGYVDCDDDDCWPYHSCVTSAVTVVTQGYGGWERFKGQARRNAHMYVSDIAGEVRFYGQHGTEVCDWERSYAYWSYSYGTTSFNSSYGDVPTLSSQCAFTTFQPSQWHPQVLFLMSTGPVVGTTSDHPFLRLTGSTAYSYGGGAFSAWTFNSINTGYATGSAWSWTP